MTLDAFIEKHKLIPAYKESALKWFKPLVDDIALHQKRAEGTLFVGLNGCQGSGKSTLADYMAMELEHSHLLKVVVCSLDDFYLPHKKRVQLGETVHPLLKTRGVPGTHDINLLEQVLVHCQQSTTMVPLAIPRFDKATDNPAPHGQWPHVTLPIDVVIFEGWCWGVKSQDEEALIDPINELEQYQDPDATWRRYVNAQLQHGYEPLYALMDKWVMLRAPGFAAVADWREEQESKLREKVAKQGKDSGTRVMSPAEVQQFIQYFQRLTEHGLTTLPSLCDWVFDLDLNRQILSVTNRSKDSKE